ncbi:hypothetical protein VVD49_21085 [Uliginosibacterium sp. H3]|uniref:Uncharacterized protein n=1 Tax=Uliginosibacterium silvisoli TaxID=3114758 RepID=A0ABU6K9E0_9RHOO|nr:hypothetical protein [Uliginosibacterium sp. H3]
MRKFVYSNDLTRLEAANDSCATPPLALRQDACNDEPWLPGSNTQEGVLPPAEPLPTV